MNRAMVSQYANYGARVLWRAEHFWEQMDAPSTPHELLRFSALMGILPFSGYLLYYVLFGEIWNWWPFVRSILPVTRGLMCAGLQWIFFVTFPLICALALDPFLPTHHSGPEFNARVTVTTYSMTPLFLASLFVGVPFVNRVVILLGFSTFVYLHYYGYRIYCGKGVVRSAVITLITAFLFALIRQMFVFVIGF